MADERRGAISGCLFWLLDELGWDSEILNEERENNGSRGSCGSALASKDPYGPCKEANMLIAGVLVPVEIIDEPGLGLNRVQKPGHKESFHLLSDTNPLGSLLRAYPDHPCRPYPEDPCLCTLSTPYAENHDSHCRGSSCSVSH